MGNEQPKPVHKPSIEDSIIDMKIQAKTVARAGKKAEKDATLYQKKAKEALKKNNEEAAKMYLMTAASKNKEGTFLTIQRKTANEPP
jgi:charged multivesicular body protein 1